MTASTHFDTEAPATPVAAPLSATAGTVSDAVFADLGAAQHEISAPVAVIAGEETHSADLAVIAGLALAVGGLPGAFIKQEETRKVPATPATPAPQPASAGFALAAGPDPVDRVA